MLPQIAISFISANTSTRKDAQLPKEVGYLIINSDKFIKRPTAFSFHFALSKIIENSIIKDSHLLNLIGKSQFELEAFKKVKSISEKFKDYNATHELASEMSDEEITKHIKAIEQIRKQMG